MPVLLVAAAIAAVASLAGSAIGYAASEKSRQQQEKWIQAATDAYGNIDLPKLKELIVKDVGPTRLAEIQTDPRYKQAEFSADDALKTMGESGGLTLGDKAALEAGMESRGQLGSGAQLAMQLQNQQQAAQQASDAGAQTAGQAQARAYQAILDRARLAQTNQAQDWNQQAQVASAQDAINRQNQLMQYQVQTGNNSIAEQNFQNQMSLAAGKSGQAGNAAQYHQQAGSNIQQAWNQAGQGVGNIAAGAYTAYNTPSQAPAAVAQTPVDTSVSLAKPKIQKQQPVASPPPPISTNSTIKPTTIQGVTTDDEAETPEEKAIRLAARKAKQGINYAY
jgi:hypothetical protein